MGVALWVQDTDVDYTADRDRRLIGAIWNPGVIDGLVISSGGGANASISAGRAVVSDGAGGAAYVYFDAATTLALSLSTTNNIYITVPTNPTAVNTSALIVTGAAPTVPYLLIGTATTNGTAFTSASNVRAAAESPTVIGKYLPLTGGTVSGTLATTRLTVGSLFSVGGTDTVPLAPLGIRLGGAYPTARHYARASRSTALAVPNGTWTAIQFDTNGHNGSDYSVQAHANTSGALSANFYTGVAGDYSITGHAYFADPGTAVGARAMRVVRFNSAGVQVWATEGTNVVASAASYGSVGISTMMDAALGDYFQFQVYHSQGASLSLLAGNYSAGTMTHGAIRLIQAD